MPERTRGYDASAFEKVYQSLLRRGRLRTASGVLRLEPYQVLFLRDRSTRRVVLKSRQVGFSWVFALEALAEAHRRDGALAIFVSLNREEAQGKIDYARALYEQLPEALRRPVRHASRTELRFEGGGRLLSFPCRAPRGRSGADLYLDELAFYRDDEQVYQGALPVISRGGRITLASTPFGERGVFWKAIESLEAGRLPEGPPKGTRGSHSSAGLHVVPWWECSWLRQGAPPADIGELGTEERVARFGSPQLRRILGAMDVESFQQEYECRFVDAAASWIPYEQLMPCVREDLCLARDVEELNEDPNPLFAGYDVGRSHHASELIVVAAEGEVRRLRLCETLRGAEFAVQKALLGDLLRHPGVVRLCIDATGLGSNLAEDLAREHRTRVEAVTFTGPVKESLANLLRLKVEGRRVLLAPERDLVSQIHSVRRVLTVAGAARFDVDASERHHADKFWALALALYAAESPAPRVRARRC